MDDLNSPAEAPVLPLQAATPPPCPPPTGGGGKGWGSEPPPFVPLRLVLDPNGPSVEFNRPEMLVGRHSTADLRLREADVSRRHCRFVFSEGRWQVFDLNSLNGIFVNGERLSQATLANGDVIRIGSYSFLVEMPTSAAIIPMPGADLRRAEEVLESIGETLPKADDAGSPKKKAS